MRLICHLNFNGDCEDAFRFYQSVLGGQITTMLRYGESPLADQTPMPLRNRIAHATLLVDGQELAGADLMPEDYRRPAGFSVILSVAEPTRAREIFAALGSGDEVRMPMQETFWSAAFGVLVDRFGIPWEINCEQVKTATMEYSLRPAIPSDLQTVLAWIESPEILKLWAGPVPTFPPNVEKTWWEIEATDQNSFSLVDPSGCIVGFGQTLCREPNAIHLGRIIVSPEFRGKGLGRLLCDKLIQTGIQRSHPEKFTLNVHRSNHPAVALYKALGFVILSENKEHDSYLMSLRKL